MQLSRIAFYSLIRFHYFIIDTVNELIPLGLFHSYPSIFIRLPFLQNYFPGNIICRERYD